MYLYIYNCLGGWEPSGEISGSELYKEYITIYIFTIV